MLLFDKLGSIFKWVVSAALVLFVMLSLKQCNDKDALKKELALIAQKEKTAANNLKVLQDTMEYWQDEAGNYKSEISILTADKETIKDQFDQYKHKFDDVVGKEAKDQQMIAYLENQIKFKDQFIAGLTSKGSGASISSDSSITIDMLRQYDSLNYYRIKGDVAVKIKDNKLTDGTVQLNPEFGMSLALAMSKDKEGIVHITSSTKFPAQVQMSGVNMIERELNTSYSGYLGIGFSTGYGLTLQKQPQFTPFVGLTVTYMPSWLTIKLGKKYK